MATSLEYALMAGASYVSTRDTKNRFPVPQEWTAVTNPPHFNDDASGFEAIAFQNGSEIVISFAGTYDQSSADKTADIDLATGVGTMQLYQAALYYLQVRESTNAPISFTGHSLGGGLAALMAVMFDKQAVTFDQAPFANAARVPVRDCVVSYLNDHGYTNARLASLAPELLSYNGNGQRSGNVTNEYVDGELLHTFPFSAFSTIGTQLPPLTHGGNASAGDLHSQALLTAFKQSGTFQQMTFDLPSLLELLFNQNMFAHATDTSDANILDLLVRHQAGGVPGIPVGGDGMLTRFTSDMDKLNQLTASTTPYPYLTDALIAFAMEKYYRETTASPGYKQELFTLKSGGMQFDTTDVAPDITKAKGYTGPAFADYLCKYLTAPRFSLKEEALIKAELATLIDWSVAVGSSGMSAADSKNQGAFMLGNDGGDTFTGGTANDLLAGVEGDDRLDGGEGDDTLLGGGGDDLLVGGTGKDRLEGGKGNDTYQTDDSDTILDSDGKGSVFLNGQQLTRAERDQGAPCYLDAAGNSYILVGSNLVINGGLVIRHYSKGDLGITLTEKDPNNKPNPLLAPFNQAQITLSPLVLDLDGNGIATTNVEDSPVFFDLDGNGFAERTGWVNGADGLLVRDLNGDGRIDTGAELFGNHTRLKNGAFAANGYAALADLDDNQDGQLDSQDAAWGGLKLWRDANGDGLSQSSELQSLAAAGIGRLATDYTENPETDAAGNQHRQQGTYTRTNGSTGQSEDIWFLTDPSNSRQVAPLDLGEDLRALPELQGYGNVASLRQVMAQRAPSGDTRLQDLLG